LSNIASALLYSNEQNLTAFTFAGYSAVGSNANGTDISVGTHSHGGALKFHTENIVDMYWIMVLIKEYQT
jgi:hypothetical protein